MKLLYFGCWDCVGHYLVDQNGKHVKPTILKEIDGKYPNKSIREDEQDSTITHEQGWTILAMWDRSIDKRYGSNAAFLIEGTFTKDQMWEMAHTTYPKITQRLVARPKLKSICPICKKTGWCTCGYGPEHNLELEP